MRTPKPVAIDLCCGEGGWTDGLLARGFRVIGYDVKRFPKYRGKLIVKSILDLTVADLLLWNPRVIVCSTPCEEFSIFGMPMFHPSPKFPALGIQLFEHARALCECAGVPYIMENVRCAQEFVGDAVTHIGPFYFWGTGVPALLPMFAETPRKHIAMTGEVIRRCNGDRDAIRAARRVWERENRHKRLKHVSARIPFAIASYIGGCYR